MSRYAEDCCPRCGEPNLCFNVMLKQQKSGVADQQVLDKVKDAETCWCSKMKLTDSQRALAAEYGNSLCCLCENCLTEIKLS